MGVYESTPVHITCPITFIVFWAQTIRLCDPPVT
jgi:hypothetical protein